MKNKWLVLIAWMGVALSNQMLWMNLSPLITTVSKQYGMAEDIVILLLILIFPLMYVILGVPTGNMVDKHGYKKVVSIGALIMSIGGLLRIIDGSFWILFTGQLLVAISQPFIINGISKLVADYFKGEEANMATGLGTAGMFIGMGLGAGITVPVIDGMGYSGAMSLMAGIAIFTSLFFAFYVKETNESKDVVSVGSFKDYGQLLKNKNILIINIISFLALGFFNGYTGLIEPILAAQKISKDDAGMIAGALIGGGILGASIIPIISDKIQKRKIFILIGSLAAAALAYPSMTGNNFITLLILGVVLGFIFLPGYPLLIASSEAEAGKAKAGASTGLLMFSGNLGGIVAIMGMSLMSNDSKDWTVPVYFCCAFVFLAVIFTFMMKEPKQND